MKNQNSKLAIGVAIVFEIISLINAIFNIMSKQWFIFIISTYYMYYAPIFNYTCC